MRQATLGPRSVLFMPASKPDMAAKIPQIHPDVAVIDLEDAVAADAKDEAREQLRKTLAANAALLNAGVSVLIRVNEVGSPWYEKDIELVRDTPGVGLVLPKAESRDTVARVRALLPERQLLVGLESGLGVADAREILAAEPDGCYFGAEDYVRELGGRRTEAGLEVLYARSQVVLAARLTGCYAIDQAVVAVHDQARFDADATQARELGYSGKLCLHPKQVEAAHRTFSPSSEEIAHAHRVLEAAADAGLAIVDGEMVDQVHIRQARAVIGRVEVQR